MKKLFVLTLCAIAVTGCKTEIEKDVSLNTLLNEPIKTETALLNVEISSCNSHEDSRKPSDALIKIQEKIPTVFAQAKYKECFSKKMNSFASFEIPIGVGKVEDNTILENDISVYSYKNRQLNIRTSDKLAENIRNFVKREYINNLEFNILLNVTNDTGKNQDFMVYSAYVNDAPTAITKLNFKDKETLNFRLSNASADSLWLYQKVSPVFVLSSPFNIDEVTKAQ
ncbi:hypothetical protein BH925_04175 [Rodentibacter pneumotropicus]|uniref:DUF7424 family protein n=1 Tax=Rodentibacter pneumotropicus TaxID=758 RepID=UPI000988B113|nr:hypothetical protein [Rodentibacter pneumotropicus]OOF60836.1 hypothetical protein BH925_04175 [Rodentibacter pneumotropicus]